MVRWWLSAIQSRDTDIGWWSETWGTEWHCTPNKVGAVELQQWWDSPMHYCHVYTSTPVLSVTYPPILHPEANWPVISLNTNPNYMSISPCLTITKTLPVMDWSLNPANRLNYRAARKIPVICLPATDTLFYRTLDFCLDTGSSCLKFAEDGPLKVLLSLLSLGLVQLHSLQIPYFWVWLAMCMGECAAAYPHFRQSCHFNIGWGRSFTGIICIVLFSTIKLFFIITVVFHLCDLLGRSSPLPFFHIPASVMWTAPDTFMYYTVKRLHSEDSISK